MRKMLFLLAAVTALAAAPPAAAKTVTVAITKAGLAPAAATIEPGDTVTWRNADTARHSVVADSGEFASPVLSANQTFSFTFPTAGTVRYHDGTRATVKGRVVVKAAAVRVTVSIEAARQIVIVGGEAMLSGTVSTLKPGETVMIVAQRYDGVTTRTQVKTEAGGAWSFEAQPRIQTAYRAEFQNATSSAVTVKVRPRVSLRKVARTKFAASVVAARSLAGRVAVLSRWAPRLHRWTVVKRVVLRSSATPTLSVATIRLKVRRGVKLRLFLSESQAGPGYLSGQSNFIVA